MEIRDSKIKLHILHINHERDAEKQKTKMSKILN